MKILNVDPLIIANMRDRLNPRKEFSYTNSDHLRASIENERIMREKFMSKSDTYKMCDYILSQDHERSCLVDDLQQQKDEGAGKKDLRISAYNHIFYIAFKSLHGRGEAGKQITEIIKEVCDG